MSYIKKILKYLILIVIYFIYLLKSLFNYFRYQINKNQDNLYLPNLAINNVIYINPNKIKYANSVPIKFRKNTKFVFDFNWDKKNEILEKHLASTVITCNELFVENKKIKECKNYFIFKDQLKKKRVFRNCRNNEDIINFYKKKIKLYNSIKKNGIHKNFRFNIQFMIDRNFNLVKINSGSHRMAMSRILNLKKIPVEIKIVHSKCLEQNNNKKIAIRKINTIIRDIEEKYA